jgi:hypothetical protein
MSFYLIYLLDIHVENPEQKKRSIIWKTYDECYLPHAIVEFLFIKFNGNRRVEYLVKLVLPSSVNLALAVSKSHSRTGQTKTEYEIDFLENSLPLGVKSIFIRLFLGIVFVVDKDTCR